MYTHLALVIVTGFNMHNDFAVDAHEIFAYAHLAMAGMVTALNMTILAELGSDSPTRATLSRRLPFYLGNVSLLVPASLLPLAISPSARSVSLPSPCPAHCGRRPSHVLSSTAFPAPPCRVTSI